MGIRDRGFSDQRSRIPSGQVPDMNHGDTPFSSGTQYAPPLLKLLNPATHVV